jgi:hypothetical protein
MASVNPMLSLFKEQLVAECAELVDRRGLKNQGQGLIWWYFTRLHNLSEVDVEEIVCDGGGDLGIDAIWIDDDELVHFYQFKDPERVDKVIAAGDVDRFLAGLRVIFSRKHRTIANDELRDRIEEVIQRVPSGYRLHLVSSAGGLPIEAEVKLNALVGEMSISSAPNFFQWAEEPLSFLQDKFYQKKLPAVGDPISFKLDINPYVVRAAAADSYFSMRRARSWPTCTASTGSCFCSGTSGSIKEAQRRTVPSRRRARARTRRTFFTLTTE